MNKPVILIVDDEPANCFLLEGLLSQNGYEPLAASGGQECLDILREKNPDLILLDIMMPRMTGLEVLDIIIKDPSLSHIPVIMVSAKTGSSDIREALNMGAIDYIKKPFDEMELLARVRVGVRLKKNEDGLRDMIDLRNDFVKIISHDLRSPFTAIHGFAEILLKSQNLSVKQMDSLNYIVQAVEYSDDYFNKLLSWTMLDHGDLELMISHIFPKLILDGLVEIFAEKAKEKKIIMENTIEAGFSMIADETFFRQVLSNLISNALKYTPEKGRVTFLLDKDKVSDLIIISDTGIGMPEYYTPDNIFDDGLMKSQKGTMGEKGTGIGLSICKKILDAHNFGFTFRRKDPQGTNFIISVPRN